MIKKGHFIDEHHNNALFCTKCHKCVKLEPSNAYIRFWTSIPELDGVIFDESDYSIDWLLKYYIGDLLGHVSVCSECGNTMILLDSALVDTLVELNNMGFITQFSCIGNANTGGVPYIAFNKSSSIISETMEALARKGVNVGDNTFVELQISEDYDIDYVVLLYRSTIIRFIGDDIPAEFNLLKKLRFDAPEYSDREAIYVEGVFENSDEVVTIFETLIRLLKA